MTAEHLGSTKMCRRKPTASEIFQALGSSPVQPE